VVGVFGRSGRVFGDTARMFAAEADRERLDRAPIRLPLPRRANLVRWSVATALVALAALVLLAGTPTNAPPGCREPPPSLPGPVRTSARPVPPPGTVGVPVTLAAAGAAGIVRAGDHVDVVTGTGSVLAEDVLVLAVRAALDGAPDGAGLYVAAPVATARRLAGVAPEVPLAITVRPP
jgi:hypothetical protein